MEVPRAMQTFPESGLRAAAASGRDAVPDHIRSDNAALRTVAAGRHLEKAGRVVLLRRSQSPRLGLAVRGYKYVAPSEGKMREVWVMLKKGGLVSCEGPF